MATSLITSAQPQPQHSAFVELRRSPRLYVFMLVMLLGAMSLGASAVAKLDYATQLTGNELGIGLLAILAALGGAVMGLPAGTLVDRFNPRRMLLGVLLTMVCVHFGTVALLTWFTPNFSVFMVLSFIEGAVAAVSIPAIASTQAALVPAHARGAAEIINLLRLSVGAILGTIIASSIDKPEMTLIGCGFAALLISIAFWFVTRSITFVRPDSRSRSRHPIRELLERVRGLPLLRQTVIADLVLRFVIPTQLVNLFIVDKGAKSIAALVLLGGVVGVALANIILACTGLTGRLDRRARISFAAYAVNMVLGSLLMINEYLITNSILLVAIVIIGSGLCTYTQGLLAAMIQQRSPDDIRGRLTGGLAGARMLLVAAGVVMGTMITTVYFTQVFSWVLVALALIAMVGLRGFSRIGSSV